MEVTINYNGQAVAVEVRTYLSILQDCEYFYQSGSYKYSS